MAKTHKRTTALTQTIFGFTLGIGISAIYLLPALLTQDYVSINIMTQGRLYYENNFLFSDLASEGFTKHLYRMMRLTVLMAIITGGFLFHLIVNRNGPIGKQKLFWLAVAVVCYFMMVPLSKPFWKLMPILQAIQFPWRFHIVLTIALTVLVTLEINSISRPLMRSTVVLIIIILSCLLLNWMIDLREHFPKLFTSITSREEACPEAFTLTRGSLEYRPKWSRELQINREVMDWDNAKITVGRGNVEILHWKPRNISLKVNAETDALIVIKQLYYPGWSAQVIGERQHPPLLIKPTQYPKGLLSIKVPGGHHKILLQLKAGMAELAGQVLSFVSVLIAVFVTFWFRKTVR